MTEQHDDNSKLDHSEIPSGPRRLDFVDGARAAAALAVLLAHSYYQPQNGYYASRWMTHLGLTYGRFAVVAFIVISGFCLGLPTVKTGNVKNGWLDFYMRRIVRILPTYYACLGLSIAFIAFWANQRTGTVWDNSLPLSPSTVLNHIFLTHDLPVSWQILISKLFGIRTLDPVLAHGDISYPLWSIAVEFQLYLLFPLILLVIRKLGITLACVIGALVGIAVHEYSPINLDSATPWYLGQFMFGVAAAHVVSKGTTSVNARKVGLILIAIVLAVLVIKGKGFYDKYEPYLDLVFAGGIASLLAAKYLSNKFSSVPTVSILETKTMVWIGAFSYSLYLVHAPILHILERFCNSFLTTKSELRFLFLIVLSPLVIGICYLFHCAFEKPVIKWLQRSKTEVTST